MLGPAGTVEGFDTFWNAATVVVPDLAGPADYIHHRFGDVETLRAIVDACGWKVTEIRPLLSERYCTEDELWRWLWGSLPLRTTSGSFLAQAERVMHEAAIRREFFAAAERMRVGNAFLVRSLANLVMATAVPSASPAATTQNNEHETPSETSA